MGFLTISAELYKYDLYKKKQRNWTPRSGYVIRFNLTVIYHA